MIKLRKRLSKCPGVLLYQLRQYFVFGEAPLRGGSRIKFAYTWDDDVDNNEKTLVFDLLLRIEYRQWRAGSTGFY